MAENWRQAPAVSAGGGKWKDAPAVKQKPGVAEDMLKAAGSGLATGTIGLGGIIGDVATGVGNASGFVSGLMGAPPEEQERMAQSVRRNLPFVGTVPNSGELQSLVTDVTGWQPYEPQTTAGQYTRTIAEFAPGAAAMGGGSAASIGRSLVQNALLAGGASEAAGQLTDGTALEPYARVGGALLGGLSPNIISPLRTPAARKTMGDALRKEGVTELTAGQRTGNTKLRYTESELGGPKYANMMEKQAEQFTAAALRRAGIQGDRATPDALQAAETRIGGEFSRLGNQHTANIDTQFAQDVQALQDAYSFGANPLQKGVVDDIVNDIIGVIQKNNGSIPGQQYNIMRSRLSRLARTTPDNQVADAVKDMQSALDDVMERSIQSASPDDMAAWKEARTQWRNLLVLERAATGAGEDAAMGLISPAKLREATIAVQGRRNYARGLGDFDELARSGEAIMRPLPQSGTAPRTAVRNVVSSVPTLLGAGVGGASGDAMGAIIGAMAGAAAPGAIGRAVLSGPGRAYLANDILPMTGRESVAAALANSTIEPRIRSGQAAIPFRP